MRTLLMVAALALVGCGSQARIDAERQAALAARVEAEAARAEAEAAAAKSRNSHPRFESELLVTHRTNGGEGTSSHRSTSYESGKPFSAVENSSTTIKGDDGIQTFTVRFIEHRDGKDRYELKATIGDAKGEQTTTSEKDYDGKRQVVYQGEHATLTLQPPSK